MPIQRWSGMQRKRSLRPVRVESGGGSAKNSNKAKRKQVDIMNFADKAESWTRDKMPAKRIQNAYKMHTKKPEIADASEEKFPTAAILSNKNRPRDRGDGGSRWLPVCAASVPGVCF